MLHTATRKWGRGSSLAYVIVVLVAMLGLTSLGVDLGRVRLAKAELQSAVDAAARYAATGLGDGTAAGKATAAAADNNVDGSRLVLSAGDVTLGTWADGAFTAGGAAPNAVRVVGQRTSARGNAVPLMFAQA